MAYFTPLYFEVSAALLIVEEHYEVLERGPGQTIRYHLGCVGDHNVAIACFPAGEIGIGIAAGIGAEV